MNTIFDPARASNPFGIGGITFNPVLPRNGAENRLRVKGEPAAPLRFLCLRSEADDPGAMGKGDVNRTLPDLVAADILGLLAEGSISEAGTPLHPGDIAVLVRTNDQGRRMQEALRKTGVPSVLTSQESVFESFEAGELWQVLNAAAAPSDRMRLATALSTDLLGVPGERLDAFRGGDDGWDAWVACFREWRRVWQDAGFIQMITRIFHGVRPGRPLLP